MAIVEEKCKNCDGMGRLPPLGGAGDPTDIKRFFPRPCDACSGTGKVLSNVNVDEEKPTSALYDSYTD